MTEKIDFYGEELNTYKANFHMHSTTSDGKFSLQEVVNLYREEKYDILAATDHRATNRVSKIDSGDLLLMSGMEVHPQGPRGMKLHLLALNIPEDFENPSELPYQEAIDRVRATGGESILAHPYWSGLNSSDIMAIKNLIGIEVYNTATRYIGKAYNMQVWDNILQLGYHLPAIAVDDTHHLYDLFQGWTVICAKEKTPKSVMSALKSGSFYSSQGPEFYQLSFENNILQLECSPCEEIIVMSDCERGFCGTVSPGYKGTNLQDLKKTQQMTSYETKIPDNAGLTYLRCQIKDSNGRYAWSSPIKL